MKSQQGKSGQPRILLNRQAKRLNDETRFQRVRDLEHYCRLYVNAYVLGLEGNRTMRLSLDKAKCWARLLDIMFGLLLQEGVVEKYEEEDDEDSG